MADLDEIKKNLGINQNLPVVVPKDNKPIGKKFTKAGKPVKGGEHYIPNGRGHGTSGGRPLLASTVKNKNFKAWMDDHVKEQVWAQVRELDKNGMATGKIITMKLTRLERAVQKLYEIGVAGEGNADAIEKWLSRYLGKAATVIKGGDEDDVPININIQGFSDMLKKIYGSEQ